MIKDRTGQKFGRLLVLKLTLNRDSSGGTIWKCRCDCGSVISLPMNSLVTGNTVSCGCFNREQTSKRTKKRNTTHGKSGSPEYVVWWHMISRCHNTKDPQYADYGARGIAVCKKWRESFANFYKDMGDRPSTRHQIDRRNNDDGYRPSNCRWVLPARNCRNRRSTRILTINGVERPLMDWAEKFAVNPFTVRTRLGRGWSDHDAVFGR